MARLNPVRRKSAKLKKLGYGSVATSCYLIKTRCIAWSHVLVSKSVMNGLNHNGSDERAGPLVRGQLEQRPSAYYELEDMTLDDSASRDGQGSPRVLRAIGIRVGAQRFMVPVSAVESVLTPPEVARVPQTAAWLSGIANWRGQVLPVIDLACFAWGEASQAASESRVLVVAGATRSCGFLVDEVYGLQELEHDRIEEVDTQTRDACGELGDWLTARLCENEQSWALLPLEAFANITEFSAQVVQSEGEP